MHLVIPYQMFDSQQKIVMYENGECISTDYVATTNLAAALYSLCTDNPSIDQVDIIGNQNYLEKIKKQVQTKFKESSVKINIVNR